MIHELVLLTKTPLGAFIELKLPPPNKGALVLAPSKMVKPELSFIFHMSPYNAGEIKTSRFPSSPSSRQKLIV